MTIPDALAALDQLRLETEITLQSSIDLWLSGDITPQTRAVVNAHCDTRLTAIALASDALRRYRPPTTPE